MKLLFLLFSLVKGLQLYDIVKINCLLADYNSGHDIYSVGVILYIRNRYIGTPNEYKQYKIKVNNEKFSIYDYNNFYTSDCLELIK